MTTLVMAAILLFGVMSYRLLPVSDMPSIDFPTISVSAGLPGASPETMASAVATTLERQFSTIAGLESMNSSSAKGSTNITLQFSLDRDIDAAAQDVQSAISQATHHLPDNMPSPPTFRKVNPADQPVLFLAISSPSLLLSKVFEYADTYMAQRISTIEGVAQVQVYGSTKYAVRILLDPGKLAVRGIGLDEAALAVQRNNVNLPSGNLDGPHQAFTIQTDGQLTNASEFRKLVIAWRDGSPVRLEDVGDALDDVENDKSMAWFGDVRAIILAIQRQPGTNTVKVVDAVKTLLPTFRAQIPAAINMDVLYDRSISIRDSVAEVKFTLVLTMGLVVLVIFLFLRKISATVIPSLALPMSVIATFAVMHLLHFSLDNLSLIALTLAVGFVVDDAIVMLENIVRHVEQGEPPHEAALRGSREIGFTILSMTLSLVAVFIPVLFMGGIIGRILNEFAVTIAASILVSGFVSLSLTPMLCSRFLQPHRTEKHGALFNAFERFFDGMLATYRWTLRLTLRHRFATFVVFVATLVLTVYLFIAAPKGLISGEDLGQIMIQTEAAQGVSFATLVEHQKAVADILKKDPNIAAFMSSASGGGAGNTGRFFTRLKPREERKMSAEEVIQSLRPKLSVVPGVRVYLQNLASISFGARMSRSQYQFTIQGPDTDELYRYAPILESRMRDLPGFQDVSSDLLIANPQVNVEIDRDKAAALGVSVRKIEETLNAAYGSTQVSAIDAATDQYQVIMELAPQYQQDASSLSLLYIRSDSGELIPLSTVAKVTRGVGPLTINHQGQLPSVTTSFNLKPGTALGDAKTAVENLAAQTLPDTISYGFQGTAQAFASSMRGLGILLVMAILIIYIVLGILYESFIHPITILSGLPSAGVGALLALMLFRMELGLYSFVGIIMLVGIVKKNAIMMIDFALDAQRRGGLAPADAIYQGALIRFRPIMMTTMSALMGCLPIAIGIGSGSATRRPLGIAVVGGLLLSQLLTLYISPVFYVYLESFRSRVARLFASSPAPDAPPEPAGK